MVDDAADPFAAYPRRYATRDQDLSATQSRLLDAAAAAFTDRGYDATSIDEIARAIGATKGTVYYSYRSKIEVFIAVYERGMLLLEESVADSLAALTRPDALEMLRAVCTGHARNIMRHFTYHVAVQQGVAHRAQLPLRERDRRRLHDLNVLRDQHESLVESLISAGVREGSIRPVPVSLATRTLIGGVVGIDVWFRPREDQPDADRVRLSDDVVDLLLIGLAPPGRP